MIFTGNVIKKAQPDGDDNGRQRNGRKDRYTANTEHRTPARHTRAPEPTTEARTEVNRFPKGGECSMLCSNSINFTSVI